MRGIASISIEKFVSDLKTGTGNCNIFNFYASCNLTSGQIKRGEGRFPLVKTMICTMGKMRITHFPNSTDDGFT